MAKGEVVMHLIFSRRELKRLKAGLLTDAEFRKCIERGTPKIKRILQTQTVFGALKTPGSDVRDGNGER